MVRLNLEKIVISLNVGASTDLHMVTFKGHGRETVLLFDKSTMPEKVAEMACLVREVL